MKTPFLGPAYRSRSKNLADSLLINLYPEIVETQTGKDVGGFYMCPGLDLLASVGPGPVRAAHVTAGILYVVSGGNVYSVDTSYASTLLGILPTSSGPCQMIDNGLQTLIVDGNVWQTILNVTVDNAGTGGNDGIYALPIPAPASGGVQATGLFTISSGSIASATLIYGGANYPADIILTNADLASVPGVGALTGAQITLAIGGGVAFAIANDFTVESVLVATTGGQADLPYVPGDTITLAGGTFSNPAIITIETTQLSTFASGSTNGIVGYQQLNNGTGFAQGYTQADVPGLGGTGSGSLFFVAGPLRPGGTAHASLTAPGQGYTVGDVLILQTSQGTGITVGVTSVHQTGIVNGGTGGTPGPVTLTGTTGTGAKFQISGTISIAGGLESVGAVLNGGAYTVNPTDLNAEPVTGGGLTGAVISIIMGANAATVINGGTYTQKATTLGQGATTGIGVGATWTPTWSAAGADVAFVPVSLPFPGASTAAYQDGFGLINQLGTNNLWQSNILDLTTWDPLNFSQADSQPDDIVAIHDARRELWVIKEYDTEIWINAGLNGFAFQRLDGVFIETGCVAPASVARVSESLIWLTQSKEGQSRVVLSSGYNLGTISTHALQYAFEQYSTVADAFAYTYQQEGHTFYVLTFPTGNATWVYDVTESAALGIPCWHERATFYNGLFSRHLSNCYALFNNQCIVGDFQNGNLYAFNLDTETDNGAQRKWVRSWRALPKPTMIPQRFSSLQIDMQTGIGVPDGTNPQVVLQWSDDGGHIWSDERIQAAGQVGQTALRVKFNRLGSTRRNSGLDRIFKLSSTDAFGVALIGADLE